METMEMTSPRVTQTKYLKDNFPFISLPSPFSLLRPRSATTYTSPNLPVYFQFVNLSPFQPAKSRLSHSLVTHSFTQQMCL